MTCCICKKEGHNKRNCKTNIVKVEAKAETDIKEKVEAKVEAKVETDIKDKADEDVEIVKELMKFLALEEVNHEEKVMKFAMLKDAVVYCVLSSLSPQIYGPLLEKFICKKFNYNKNKAKDSNGDCSKDGKNCEVKVSFGGKTRDKFNFVQIRPSHYCETYILIAYNLSHKNANSKGELYIFKVPKEDIKKIVVSFGGYAHGTKKKNGEITIESLNDEKNIKEYDLRPTINSLCWKALIPFRVSESEL